jgi:2-phosphoglycerate kinase
MLLFKRNVNRSWMREIKLFLHSLAENLAKTQIRIMSKSLTDRIWKQNFKAQSEAAQDLIKDVVKKYELNLDQERAFRIVANHAVTPGTEQLIMYMGGIGGTGKSQVINLL